MSTVAVKPPWRSADIADSILMRSTRPTLRAASVHGHDEVELETDADEVYVMLYETSEGIQPVVWPMKLGYPREDH